MPASLHLLAGLFLAALVVSPDTPRDSTPDLVARFEHEPNPVHKAKMMQKLGGAEFREIEKDVANRQFDAAAQVLGRYHAQAEECSKQLDDAHIDAVKKPAGFKQLQMSVREALERLDRLISTMNADEQVRLRKDRDDLEELNSHLLQELFPGQKPRRSYHHIPIP
ncbi:MAG: hypothetical protein KGL02_11175 [Acidobacteriota bacterium]|nr:hypothetical protein [Acidobacteriota bacterium]